MIVVLFSPYLCVSTMPVVFVSLSLCVWIACGVAVFLSLCLYNGCGVVVSLFLCLCSPCGVVVSLFLCLHNACGGFVSVLSLCLCNVCGVVLSMSLCLLCLWGYCCLIHCAFDFLLYFFMFLTFLWSVPWRSVVLQWIFHSHTFQALPLITSISLHISVPITDLLLVLKDKFCLS